MVLVRLMLTVQDEGPYGITEAKQRADATLNTT
jgi:hypothetical protein